MAKRSKRRSPRKSSKRSKRRSPRKSSKRSKRRSPRKSSKRSKRRSPRKSSKRSKRRSPRKSSKRSTNDDIIIKKISNVVRKYIDKSIPQDTLLSVIKNEYITLKNKGQIKYISEDIYDSLTQLYGDKAFSKMTENKVDAYHNQIKKIVK